MNLYALVCSICSFVGCHSAGGAAAVVVVERYLRIFCWNLFFNFGSWYDLCIVVFRRWCNIVDVMNYVSFSSFC